MNEEKKISANSLGIRESVADAVSAVRSAQYNTSVGATTFEELVDASLTALIGNPGRAPLRLSKREKVVSIQNKLDAAVKAAKNTAAVDWSVSEVAEEDAAVTEE